jgi:hypothetical protein
LDELADEVPSMPSKQRAKRWQETISVVPYWDGLGPLGSDGNYISKKYIFMDRFQVSKFGNIISRFLGVNSKNWGEGDSR